MCVRTSSLQLFCLFGCCLLDRFMNSKKVASTGLVSQTKAQSKIGGYPVWRRGLGVLVVEGVRRADIKDPTLRRGGTTPRPAGTSRACSSGSSPGGEAPALKPTPAPRLFLCRGLGARSSLSHLMQGTTCRRVEQGAEHQTPSEFCPFFLGI